MLQRPEAFLWRRGLLTPRLTRKQTEQKCSDVKKDSIPIRRWKKSANGKNDHEPEHQNLDALKDQLAQTIRKNQTYLKTQVKLINELKQKNLERYYYKLQLKREKRLHYLMKLEANESVDIVFGSRLPWFRSVWLANLMSANWALWNRALSFFHRIRNSLAGCWWMHLY